MEGMNFIAGAWRSVARTHPRENPAHPSETVGVYPVSGKDEALAAFGAAAEAFPRWKGTAIMQRARILQRAARILEQRLEEVARDMAREVGKQIAESRVEVRRAVDLLDYYAAYAWLPQGHIVASGRAGTELRSQRGPLGVVALITPWNFPIAIPTWKMAPALIMGNCVVLKPASLGAAAAIHLVRALEEAGIPAGVVNLVIGPGTPFGQALQETEVLKALSFTGSLEVGLQVKASLAERLVRVQLEMGSKNPFIVWEDADLEEAARLAAEGAFFYAGQKCTATSRVLVHEAVYDQFKPLFLDAVRSLKVGDPLDEATQVGPLIDAGSQERVARWVERGQNNGGRVLVGGKSSTGEGYFYEPTVIEGLPLTAPLAQEEVFGPIVTLHTVSGLEDAIDGANATRYGLSASISTRNLKVADAFLDRVQAGLLHVNQPTAGVEYQAPFGGVKDSAFGPKEQGWSALDFYSDWKTQVVRP
jgi:acyl-CoA reductase-like NAD-dependent aldehyde dehydrogenase